MRRIKKNYEQYCKDKWAIEEVPLPYINWLELELQAYMDYNACGCKVISR